MIIIIKFSGNNCNFERCFTGGDESFIIISNLPIGLHTHRQGPRKDTTRSVWYSAAKYNVDLLLLSRNVSILVKCMYLK